MQAISAWSVPIRRVPCRHCRDARVCGHTTTSMHDTSTPPPLTISPPLYPNPPLAFSRRHHPTPHPTPTPLSIVRSNLDPAQPGPCRALVLLFNGLCLLAALMLKLAMASAGTAGGSVTAATVVASASAATVALSLLAAGVVLLALCAWCPETSQPLGCPQVRCSFVFFFIETRNETIVARHV